MCPRFIRSKIELVVRCLRLSLLLEVLLVGHGWVLLWRELLGRLRTLHRLLSILDHFLVPRRPQHAIPVPGEEEEAHEHAEREECDLLPHHPREVAEAIVRFLHASFLRQLVSVPFDRVKLDWVLCIRVPLEHFEELRVVLLPVPLLKWNAFCAGGVGRPRLPCHFLEVTTLVLILLILVVVAHRCFLVFFPEHCTNCSQLVSGICMNEAPEIMHGSHDCCALTAV